MKKWHYRSQKGDAGLNRKPPRLKDLGEHSVEILIRELIQNTVDAAIDSKPVKVEIEIQDWDIKRIESFFQFVGNDHIELLRTSIEKADPSVAPHLKDCKDIIDRKKESAFSLVIRESNCIGLIGPVRGDDKEKSHFDALMRKVENNEAKKETTNTGGTWGKGSSVFTYTSMLWTWFSYSKLSEPWHVKDEKTDHNTRFIGRSMLAPFFDGEENSMLGDGWFCDNDKKIDAFPFINKEADKLADKLGLGKRAENGTTFFIPFFKPIFDNENKKIDLKLLQNEFVDQVAKNWFITIYNGLLEVVITTEHGRVTVNMDYLNQIEELRFKIQLLDWYERGCPLGDSRFVKEEVEIEIPALKKDYLNKNTSFARSRRKVKTDLIIRVLDEDEDFSNGWDTVNKVALTRNKGMIVNHEKAIDHETARTESILFCGLLSKSESDDSKRKHSDLFLAYSENPAHNYWCRQSSDYDRCFMDRFEGQRPKPETSIVRLIQSVKTCFRKLFTESTMKTGNEEVCSIFRKLARLKSGGGDSGGRTLFFMRRISEDIDAEGRMVFKRRIISNSEENEIEVYIRSYVSSLEGDKSKDFDVLGIDEFSELEILDEKNNLIEKSDNPSIRLLPEQEMIIYIRTCNIDRNPAFRNLEPLIKAIAKPAE